LTFDEKEEFEFESIAKQSQNSKNEYWFQAFEFQILNWLKFLIYF